MGLDGPRGRSWAAQGLAGSVATASGGMDPEPIEHGGAVNAYRRVRAGLDRARYGRIARGEGVGDQIRPLHLPRRPGEHVIRQSSGGAAV